MILKQENPVSENGPNPKLISPTAKSVAYFRAFSEIPYSQEISDATNSSSAFSELSEQDREEVVSFLSPTCEARYKIINEMIKKCGYKNVLEIASGISPRGLVMTGDPAVNYVETDLPGILAEKQKVIEGIISKMSETRPNLHFTPVNALDTGQMLSTTSFFDGPVAVCNEGLMSYFSRQEKITFAENVRRILEEKGGVWITTDFGLSSGTMGELTGSPVVKKFLDDMLKATGRNMTGYRFKDEQDIKDFLGETGFEAEVFDQSLVTDGLTSVEKSGGDIEKIKSILSKRKVYILTPKKKL